MHGPRRAPNNAGRARRATDEEGRSNAPSPACPHAQDQARARTQGVDQDLKAGEVGDAPR